MEVKTFDEKRMKKLIKESHPEVQEYVKALFRSIHGFEDVNVKATKKIRELSAENNRMREALEIITARAKDTTGLCEVATEVFKEVEDE